MDRNIYIIRDSFEPDSAPTNRFLAFARGYGEKGINVKAVFVFPNNKYEKVDQQYENVEFIYLWDRHIIKNKYLNFLITRLNLFYFFLYLKKNDIVILYGLVHFLWLFRLNNNIKLFHERTEHPDVVGREFGIIGILKHKLYLNTCKNLDGLFVISPSLNKYFVEDVGVDKVKVHTINMIVDQSRFVQLNIQNKSNTIAYCGTISERKDGISYLLKSFATITKKNDEIMLSLMGSFENKNTEQSVLQLIRDLNIENRVKLFGSISANKMPRLLSEAKILVLSRPDNKQAKFGFPTKLGEYLMTGNPVVITKVGDIDKYLKDEENVIFSKPNDTEDFANKLLWTLENYQQAKQIGLNGRKVAMDNFNYKIESQKVLKVILKNK